MDSNPRCSIPASSAACGARRFIMGARHLSALWLPSCVKAHHRLNCLGRPSDNDHSADMPRKGGGLGLGRPGSLQPYLLGYSYTACKGEVGWADCVGRPSSLTESTPASQGFTPRQHGRPGLGVPPGPARLSPQPSRLCLQPRVSNRAAQRRTRRPRTTSCSSSLVHCNAAMLLHFSSFTALLCG